MKTLIKNGIVITQDPQDQVWEKGWLLLEEDRIAALGEGAPPADINADKIVYTGDQVEKKYYYSHSMYPGGLRKRSIGEMKKNYPVELVQKAITGMIPHNKLGDRIRTHLFVYAGNEHPHTAQKPVELKVD